MLVRRTYTLQRSALFRADVACSASWCRFCLFADLHLQHLGGIAVAFVITVADVVDVAGILRRVVRVVVPFVATAATTTLRERMANTERA